MSNAKKDENGIPVLMGVSNVDNITPVMVYVDPVTHRMLVDLAAGAGTVTSVSVTTANGISGTVATATTTPAITLVLGAITPTTIGATDSLTITKSVSAVNNFITLAGSGAFSGSEPAIVFTNTVGAVTTARISSKPGASYTASDFTIAVADSAKVLQTRLSIDVAGLVNIPNLTASQIVGTDASKNLVSLAVATYPSLTELSYAKGVTSAIQTQLNAKQATLTNSAGLLAALSDETGTGLAVFNDTPTLTTPVINGLPTGTGVSFIAVASTIVTRDGNNYLRANGVVQGYTTNATAGGTTTLTYASSNFYRFWTGTTTQTIVLPVTSTLSQGHSWVFVNNSTGAITIQSSGLNTVIVVPAGTSALVTCILASGTDAASWNAILYSTISSVETLSNKTLTSPVINTPTGIVKGDVGLGNVDNTSNATERAATATLTNKTMTGATNTLTASVLKSATTEVSISAATAPTSGQVLTATAGTTATWQTPSGGATDKSCRVYQTAVTALTTAWVACAFGAENFDTDTMHDNTTNNTRITFTTAGKYAIGGAVSTAVNAVIGCRIKLNGTTVIESVNFGNAGTPSSSNIDTIYSFSAADYIELEGYSTTQNSTGDLLTNFWAYKLF